MSIKLIYFTMKNKNKLIIIITLIFFLLVFKYNNIVKISIQTSIFIWYKQIIPSILPMYFLVDLLINYGITNIFKKNYILLVFISILLGSPSNAKYIKEFYQNNLIDINTANYLLTFSYSPSILFLYNIIPQTYFYKVILYLYITNLIIYLIFNKKLNNINKINYKEKPFIKCIKESINKSIDTLILILGIIIFYGLITALLTNINPIFNKLNIITEITNGINYIITKNKNIYLLIFIITFGGISIHTQIKSILEDTKINYKYFLLGRLISLIPLIFLYIFF